MRCVERKVVSNTKTRLIPDEACFFCHYTRIHANQKDVYFVVAAKHCHHCESIDREKLKGEGKNMSHEKM